MQRRLSTPFKPWANGWQARPRGAIGRADHRNGRWSATHALPRCATYAFDIKSFIVATSDLTAETL